jgi:hypothetical protein
MLFERAVRANRIVLTNQNGSLIINMFIDAEKEKPSEFVDFLHPSVFPPLDALENYTLKIKCYLAGALKGLRHEILDLIFERLWLPLKGISREKNIYRQIVQHFTYNFHKQNMGVK